MLQERTGQVLNKSRNRVHQTWGPLYAEPCILHTYVDDPVVGDLPAGLQPQYVEGGGLLGAEVAERGVGDVVRLQVELVEGGEELRDGAYALVGHVDAVVDGDRDEARVQRRPQALRRGCNSIDTYYFGDKF